VAAGRHRALHQDQPAPSQDLFGGRLSACHHRESGAACTDAAAIDTARQVRAGRVCRACATPPRRTGFLCRGSENSGAPYFMGLPRSPVGASLRVPADVCCRRAPGHTGPTSSPAGGRCRRRAASAIRYSQRPLFGISARCYARRRLDPLSGDVVLSATRGSMATGL
jgi:hypothetical protein